jgi:integrase
MASAFKRPHQRKPGGTWTATYTDADGRRRYKAGFTDKVKTIELARRLESEAKLVREGLIEPTDQTSRQAGLRPASSHVDDYRDYLLSKGVTERHAKHIAGTVGRVLAASGVTRTSDLRPERVQSALAAIRGKQSARTANHALGAFKAWARWLAASGRLKTSPGWLSMLKPFNERVGKTRKRRALTPAELRRLLDATSTGDPIESRRGPRSGPRPNPTMMSGRDRAMLYRVATETGLRAGELASLTAQSFDLDARTVTVSASYSKHRREDVLPLRLASLPDLAEWLRSRPPEGPLWILPEKTARMIRRDLLAAGIPEKTSEGLIDFHSLRHTFISGLIERGVDPRTVQDLARHSTITLTIDRYSHSDTQRRRAAIDLEAKGSE